MENIDVRDLPEEEAQLVAAFVEFLRRRQVTRQEIFDLHLVATMLTNGLTRLYTYN
jgi:hypothetical protein